MRKIKRLGWVMIAALVVSVQPQRGQAADTSADTKALEQRVRALERKLDADQQADATENQSVRERVEAIEKDVKTQGQTIADKLGINFHAFVDALYLYNFNNPQNRTNQLRVFDIDSNSFSLQQANLNISRKKEDENVGFVINLDFGQEAEIIHNATLWSNQNPPGTNPSNTPFELREAYITYKLPFEYLDTITLKGGKFVTLLGAEVINNYDNFNFNVSRSFSFGFGIPLTNTGILMNTPIGSMVTIDAALVNGWDNVSDNNSGKTFMGGVGFAPLDMYSFYLSGTYGPEQTDNGHSKRGVFTWVHTLKPIDLLTLSAELTYGNESNLVGPDQTKSALWYGGAGYAVFKFTDRLSAALRFEVFDDSDGTRFPLTRASSSVCPGGGPDGTCPVTAWEITPTIAYQVTQGLLWRSEYRHDEADKQVFQRSDGNFVRGQDTLTTELIYAF